MPFLDRDGVKLYYECDGAGAPVVFINGIMMSVRQWQPQVAALGEGWRCIRYDLRGQLLSDRPDHDYSFADHADDLAALLDHLGVDSAHLVAVSYGGPVALQFAHDHPGRARSLALFATLARAEPPQRARFQAWLDILDRQPRRLYDHCLAENHSPMFREASAGFIARVQAWFRMQNDAYFTGIRRLTPAIRDVNLEPLLGSIQCPVLVGAPAHDALLDDTTLALAAAIPQARLLRLPGGHAVTIEQPEQVGAALVEYLTQVEETWSTRSSNPTRTGAPN